jgi:starch synthase
MRIVFCSAEVVPFSQAGGLGDVAGSLPRAIAELGMDVLIVTPMYGMINPAERMLERTELDFVIHLGGKEYPIAIWKGTLPRSEVPVYFVDNYNLFGSRNQVYPYGQPEWELEGFLVFSQAVFELVRKQNQRPDILHVHDWHTASVATTLADIRPFDQYFSRTLSVLTIHNLHYQGVIDDTNWLEQGIIKADAVTTVSPTYAQEIQSPEFGAGLDGVIREYCQKVSGILNGIDTDLYNPETDAFIAAHYNADHFAQGKAACKEALQREFDLPVDPDAPVFGFVGRLADQKGLDLLLPVMRELKDERIQWAILGTGDPKMEEALKELNGSTARVRTYVGFNTALAMKIYAGSDMFVMPSAFEPCGLGQMIALRYGSVPVVRSVGGLRDTIFDIRREPERGNGFIFSEYSARMLKETVLAAVEAYHNQNQWQALIRRGMQENHSWRSSAEVYQKLYERMIHPAVPT